VDAVKGKVGDKVPPRVAAQVERLRRKGAAVHDDWGTSTT
jgi:hypothetical protein